MRNTCVLLWLYCKHEIIPRTYLFIWHVMWWGERLFYLWIYLWSGFKGCNKLSFWRYCSLKRIVLKAGTFAWFLSENVNPKKIRLQIPFLHWSISTKEILFVNFFLKSLNISWHHFAWINYCDSTLFIFAF